MKREEQLNHLIEMRQRDENPSNEVSDELRGRLAAAEMLARYQEIDVPLALAESIEKRVRVQIRQQARNSPPARLHVFPQPVPRRRNRHRLWKPLLSAAVLLLLLCIGTLTAAASALPGDPLYGIKQAGNQFVLIFATSPSARAQNTIGQLHSALNDLEMVVKDGRSPAVMQQALNIVAAQTKAAQMAVATVPNGTLHDSAQQNLASALRGESQTLRGLLNKVSWSMRLAITQQLGAIGQAIPTITRVNVSQQNSETLVITVTGTHFASQTRLAVNGQLQDVSIQQTPTQLVVSLNRHNWREDAQMIGVLNPDGTATQVRVVFHGHDDQQEGGNDNGDDHGGHGGSGPGGSTPTPGDDHGGSGKGGSGGKGSDD